MVSCHVRNKDDAYRDAECTSSSRRVPHWVYTTVGAMLSIGGYLPPTFRPITSRRECVEFEKLGPTLELLELRVTVLTPSQYKVAIFERAVLFIFREVDGFHSIQSSAVVSRQLFFAS